MNFNKEREQIESAHAAEVDRLIGQHRRSLQQLRVRTLIDDYLYRKYKYFILNGFDWQAQLEVKFEEELTSIKRRQENVSIWQW